MIIIGDEVKCIETGFEGIVIARAEYLDGRIRFNVQSETPTKDGKSAPAKWIEQKALTLIQPKPVQMA